MRAISAPIFVVLALVYTVGYAAAEVLLQGAGVSESAVAMLACSHSIISALICAAVFSRWTDAPSWVRSLWIAGFAVVGVADVIHAVFIWVVPFPHADVVLMLGDKLYVLFAALHAVAFWGMYRRVLSPSHAVGIVVVGLLYWLAATTLIGVPYLQTSPPMVDVVANAVYDIAVSFIVGVCVMEGLVSSTIFGTALCSAYLLIFVSDFAIRYHDSVTAAPTLSIFNYGWELGTSVLAVTLAWTALEGRSMKRVFDVLPVRSLRFQIGGASLAALCAFTATLMLSGMYSSWLQAVPLSYVLMALLISWTLSNLAALWASRNLLKTGEMAGNLQEAGRVLGYEIESLLGTYRHQNSELNLAIDTIRHQKDEMERVSHHVAHDMRSPLAVLVSYFTMVGQGRGLGEVEYRQAAARSAEKLLRISEELVSHAKACKLDRREVQLGSFLRTAVVAELRHVAASRQIDIQVSCDDGLVVDIDTDKMGRVFVNIVHNALQAIEHDRGLVRIVAGANDARELVVTIDDNGKGIDPAHLPRIFEPRFSYGKKEGLGLGLAYARRMVEAHGGRIGARSFPGFGTSLSVVIPRCVTKGAAGCRGGVSRAGDVAFEGAEDVGRNIFSTPGNA